MSPQEDHLAAIAGAWYAAPAHDRPALQQQYAATMEACYAEGWDEVPDVQERLPDDVMPQAFWDRHPECRGVHLFGSAAHTRSTDVRSVQMDERPAHIRARVRQCLRDAGVHHGSWHPHEKEA